MFTIQQIKDIHSKVKSGADFPGYIQELKALGVKSYEVSVKDGHTKYAGADDFIASSEPSWSEKAIALPSSADKLAHDLKIHQLGKTDYATFCQQSADAGVEKWIVDIGTMKCSYYDKEGNIMISEDIPTPA